MMYSEKQIHDWLVGLKPSPPDQGPDSNQDAYHFIASDFTAPQLIDFYNTQNVKAERQHTIALAICDRLDWLLDPEEYTDLVDSDRQRIEEIDLLVSFIRANLTAFFNTEDQRSGFGAKYDFVILPLVMNAT